MILLRLFYEFFKIGLFAVGGGLATIPFLYNLSDKTGWFTSQMLVDMIAVSESTPGPIGVNMATYVGFDTAGILGGIIATLGLVFPSLIIIILISKILEKFKENETVKNVFYAFRPTVVALILTFAVDIIVSTLFVNTLGFDFNTMKPTGSLIFNFKEIGLFIILFILIKKIKIHPIVFLLSSALIGCLFL